MPTFITDQETLAELHFPLGGINDSVPYERSPAVQLPTGDWSKTTPVAVNVRGYDAATNRLRGGTRAGLSRYVNAPVADFIVQQLDSVVGEGYAPPGGHMQQSQSGRVVTLVAVSQGQVFVAGAGDTTWTPAVNLTGINPPLNQSGTMFSSANNQKLYFADGVNYCYYDPQDNSVHPWTASAGSVPRDKQNNAPRLIATWRGRTVLSGLLNDPQNWFMSAVSDPTNWDYAPFNITPTQAVAGNNSPLGFVGDVVTALVPYTDDLMIVGGDHTLWAMSGDPMAGGQIDLISDSIGMAWGLAWCKAPDGTIYFLSNKTGVYAMRPGQGPPVRISAGVEQKLLDMDTGQNLFRILWNDRYQGFHLFATNVNEPTPATHFFWEARSNAWWTDTFSNPEHNPVAACTFDGNLPADRVVLLGGWDGYVRKFDPVATTDDGSPISSTVIIGPLLTADMDEVLLKDVQAILATAAGSVSYAILVGTTAEQALANGPVASGTWQAGRNLTNMVRRSGHAVWIQLTSTNAWAMEAVRCRVVTSGKVRRRGY